MAETASLPSGTTSLVPSQTINSNNSDQNRGSSGNRRRRQRQRRRNNQEPSAEAKNEADAEKQETNDNRNPPRNTNRRRGNNRRKKPNGNPQDQPKKPPEDSSNALGEEKPNPENPKENGKTNKRRNRQRNRKKYPWRRHIPTGSVDPITLDPLVSLPYPPFALVATEPYEPVSEWPIPDKDSTKPSKAEGENNGDWEQRILMQQWGSSLQPQVDGENQDDVGLEDTEEPPPKRHYHLYDGRALAYYLVSQLQFIDPLNRRDLTRDELVNLDRYLARYELTDANVAQAYDAKGITLSTAGSAANTAAGRAEILRQEAQVLLNSLFSGGGVSHHPEASQPRQQRQHTSAQQTTSSLQQQYTASQEHQTNARNQQQHYEFAPERDEGIYGDEGGGIVIIDDDENPGLRGGFGSDTQTHQENQLDATASSYVPGTLWSASRITGRNSQTANAQTQNFPALPAASSDAPARDPMPEREVPAKKGKSRSLNHITKLVAKTDPKAVQRQREAREVFVKRAMMSNLAFGAGPSPDFSLPPGMPATITATATPQGPTEGQLLRNQALADALGVQPSTVRASYNSGWARPTDTKIEMDEFGNELNATQYPDSLILQARERMDQLLRLEKKWRGFLVDDTSASLPLNPMDNRLRAFVHEYAEYWQLKTESYDLEPRRYIHCVKLRDTRAPNPLLSEAARRWRGPTAATTAAPAPARVGEIIGSKQAAGQTPREVRQDRELPPPPQRQPLPLKPRTLITPPGAMFAMDDGTTNAGGAKADTETLAQINSRSETLLGRERPRLELAPRTRPLELPPMEIKKRYDLAEEANRQRILREEKARKEREEAKKQRRILEAAFASDDENHSLASHNSDDWDDVEDQEPRYKYDEED